MSPRFVFFAHWSERIAASIWSSYECIIFHMTDVPYGRGGSPLQNLIVRGHESTMLSALRCVEELDAGPVYLKHPLSLLGSAEEIFIRADRIIEDMIVEIVEREPTPSPQQGEPTVFMRRTPSEGDLKKASSLDEWYDRVRMLDAVGYPPAFLQVGNFRLEFKRAARRVDRIEAEVTISKVPQQENK